MNCSSVDYNFIAQTLKDYPQTMKNKLVQEKNIAYKTAQVAKVADYGRLFCPNFNQDYQTTIKKNPQSYYRIKGMCAGTYDRAHGYGPGIKPFRKFK